MAIKKRAISADGTKVERRRSARFPVAVPIEVSWRGADGVPVKEEAVARRVNANGGFVKMNAYPELGSRVTLANFLSAQTAEARVLAAPNSREGVSNGIIVELVTPSESFWGVNLQVEKTSFELQNLEKALQQEDIDLRLLKEYRDAVDYIRTAANMVQQLRECQLRGLDEEEVLRTLASERMRRTVDLCLEVGTDLSTGRLNAETKGIEELRRVLEALTESVRRIGKASGQRSMRGG